VREYESSDNCPLSDVGHDSHATWRPGGGSGHGPCARRDRTPSPDNSFVATENCNRCPVEVLS
jgi:hypothetical protein